MKKWLSILLVLCLIMIPLAACGKGGDGNTGTSDPGSSGDQPAGDNILRMGISSIEGVFNPIMSDQVYDSWVTDCVFDGLVDNNEEGEYVPNLATWELSDDHRTYTFTLADGVTFHDGSTLTAEDVEFTYKTIAHPDYNGPRSYAVSSLEGYEAFHDGSAEEFAGIIVIDEKTISFTFAEGQESPSNIQHFEYGIMSKDYYAFETWEEFLSKNDEPMGTGKFTFDSWALNEHVTLNKNESYWNAEKALKIDGMVLLNVPEDSIISALSTGSIDFGQATATQENFDEIEGLENAGAISFLGNGYTFMQFNTTRDKLSDVRVRQALMFALDRQAFIEAFYGPDLASVGLAPISPASWAFPEDSSALEPYAYDQAKAAQLMDEAGWEMGDDGYRYKDGEKFTISWLVYEDSPWPGVLAGMAYDSWLELGVDLVIEKMDFNTVSERTMDAPIEEKDFDIYTMGFSLSIDPDPSGALFDADAYSEGGFNASGFRDDRSQELQTQGKNEFDQDKRAEIYEEWAIRQNELIPTVIVAYRNEVWGVADRVSGLTIDTYVMWPQSIHEVTLG